MSRHDGDTFRAIYSVRFEAAVYVPHAFQEKARRGIATPKKKLDLVWRRLRAEQHHRDRMAGARTMDTTAERGSGNVFADLDLPDAEAHLSGG